MYDTSYSAYDGNNGSMTRTGLPTRAGVAAIVAAALGGCGDDLTPKEALADAIARTQEARTARMSQATVVRAPGVGPVRLTGTGALDFSGRRARTVVDMSAMAEQAGAAMGCEPSCELETRLLDDVLYVRLPQPVGAGAAKRWIKMDLASRFGHLGLDFHEIQRMSSDPTAVLQFLRSTSGGVERAEAADVRGVPTTRYRADIDIDKYFDRLGAANSEQGRTYLRQAFVGDRIPMVVWIDDERRIRRVHVRLRMRAGPDAQAPLRMTQTIEYFDFGTTVEVEPPPSDQVGPASPIPTPTADVPGAGRRERYPPAARRQFMASCTGGEASKRRFCGCLLAGLEQRVSFRELLRASRRERSRPPRFWIEAGARCERLG